jgi:hypothetical protein
LVEARRVELFEPRAKLRKLVRRQLSDGFSDVFNDHGGKYTAKGEEINASSAMWNPF